MDNKRFQVEQFKELQKLKRRINQVIPEVYACFAKALYDNGMDADDIEALFMQTQELWQENAESMDDMIQWVSDTTGIEVRGDSYVG